MGAAVLADSFVSLAAFFGLALFMARIAGGGDGGLGRRMLPGLGTVAALMLARVLFWQTGLGLFRFATLAAAALIPLAALIVAEGLLRRHAPRWLKLFAAGGAAVFVVAAFLPAAQIDPARLWALFLFQFAAFAAIAGLVLLRDRTGLSAAENRMVERLALSLAAILPLLVTDFRTPALEVPVRLGGIAILVLCWLGLTLSRPAAGHREIVPAAAAILLTAGLATLAIGGIAGLPGAALAQAGAVVLAAGLLAAIFAESQRLSAEARRDSLLRHLAAGDISSPAAFLRGLRDHPLAGEALLLGPADLEDFDLPLLEAGFSRTPLRARADLAAEPDPGLREQLEFLFDRHDATHAMQVGTGPFALLTLAMPQLTGNPAALTELAAVQRMALLISRSGTP